MCIAMSLHKKSIVAVFIYLGWVCVCFAEEQEIISSTEATVSSSALDLIPKIIDATPTIFPPESNHRHVPEGKDTQKDTWIDRQQYYLQNLVDRSSEKIDLWFGEPDLNNPASATLRVLLDGTWDRYEDSAIRPRVRGKIKLPTLEKKLSVVFGDDSLDNELEHNIAITNENPELDPNQHYNSKRNRTDNASVALRWSEWSKRLPFESDIDLGVRSGDDLYIRLKAKKTWQLNNDFFSIAEQIYRYGIDSENYLRTNLELTHARPNHPTLSNQFSLIYADDQDEDLTWQNFSFRQHQFFHSHQFNYGLYTDGYYNHDKLRLNRWGPFISWRQPMFREWFFVQTDLNYLDDDRKHRDHYLGLLIRLEAIF